MKITAQTRLLAVIGDPVAHSLSPALHNAWLDEAGIDAAYAALRVDAASADAAFAQLSAYGLYGANVTVPHKERAARIAAVRDEASEALQAANTLKWDDKGAIAAFNTDAPGLVAALDDSAGGWRSQTGAALVIGAGGAGRAAAWGLSRAGVRRVFVANRTRAKADALAALVPRTEVLDWSALAEGFAGADLIVQTTSLGMKGQPAPDWPVSAAPAHAVVMDAVYAPLETGLLAAARARGLTALDGLGMLLHQAALAFEIWFGVKPDLATGRAALQAALAARAS